jgi:electron transport complex protein RnfB
MTIVAIGLAAGTLLVMALALSYVLGWANTAFHVEVDSRVEAVLIALPGVNCGGCGYIGCADYAEAVVSGDLINKCTVGGDACAADLAGIMGVELSVAYPLRAVIHCGAHYADRLGRSPYIGEARCMAANIVADVQGCTYGCLGFGDCTRACDYDALHIIDGLSTVNYDNCVGCGACAKVCPRNIITITPFKAVRMLAVTCSSNDEGRDVRRVCTVGCLGCGTCSRISSLFKIENNLSTIDYDEYSPECSLDIIEACEKCPRKRLEFVGKPGGEEDAADSDDAPVLIEPDFKTTVDDTEWRG